MGGLGAGGPGAGGRHSFNFFLTFTVLFSFVIAVPAHAQRAEPQTSVINGNTVTLTYANPLTVRYSGSETLLGFVDSDGNPARDPSTGGYCPN